VALQQTSGTQAPPEQRAQAQPVIGRYDGSKPGKHGTGTAGLTLGALGVVFGDIGTSPLYALQTVFTADHHAVKTTAPQVYGVISLVFWAIMIIVSVKYVSFIMRASNDGEGGIMALTALLKRQQFATRRTKLTLITLGLFGASLFYGDVTVQVPRAMDSRRLLRGSRVGRRTGRVGRSWRSGRSCVRC